MIKYPSLTQFSLEIPKGLFANSADPDMLQNVAWHLIQGLHCFIKYKNFYKSW